MRLEIKDYGTEKRAEWWCDGCNTRHAFRFEGPAGCGPVWKFNGNVEQPTFSPSLLYRQTTATPPVTSENLEQFKLRPWPQKDVVAICHTFVVDGIVQYLPDCTHKLAGLSVPLPELP
jgi:hypothetical protein